LPILQREKLTAAFFVSTGFLQGGVMFNDRVIEAVRRCVGDRIEVPAQCESGSVTWPLRSIAERRAAIDGILASIKHLAPEAREERVVRLEWTVGRRAATRESSMMMTPEQVSGLHRAGMCIGGHTRSHPILVKLADDAARQEIQGGLDDLAAITGSRPQIFAYPNGRRGSDFDSRHVAMLEESGLRFAFTTHAGTASQHSPRLELPRFTPWERTAIRFGVRAYLNVLRRVH
jgi:peptidoglycan/xylan/chitin deacetylase (PgdA/CDA1 family)